MNIVDSFSFWDGEHPALAPGDSRYVVVPPSDFSPEWYGSVTAGGRVLGGLLPILDYTVAEVERHLQHPFWRGLVLARPRDTSSLHSPGVLEILIRFPHLPVVIDCGIAGFSRPEHLETFLKVCPPRPVILTHGGQLNISGGHLYAAAALFTSHPFTLLETSGIYRQDFLEQMVQELGPRRILYGSGYPRMDERLEQERVAILNLPLSEKALIFGGNSQRIFGVPSPTPLQEPSPALPSP